MIFDGREELSSMNHKLKNMWDVSVKLFFKHLPTLETEENLHVGTELHPPMYSLIEWMDDINLIYSNMYVLNISILCSLPLNHFLFL